MHTSQIETGSLIAMNSARGNKENMLITSADDFFDSLVHESFAEVKVNTYPRVKQYIVELLNFYVDARNLFENHNTDGSEKQPNTLAELYLIANQTEQPKKNQLLKKLGDKCLYVSGFFGDSLNNKIVDIDYYAQMGSTAYSSLAAITKEDISAKVYESISVNFIELIDVLTYISQKAAIQTNQGILQLYDRYLRTGSSLAKDKLLEMGVLTIPSEHIKITKLS